VRRRENCWKIPGYLTRFIASDCSIYYLSVVVSYSAACNLSGELSSSHHKLTVFENIIYKGTMSEVVKNLHLAVMCNDHATLAQLLTTASSADINYQQDHKTDKTSHLILALQKRHALDFYCHIRLSTSN